MVIVTTTATGTYDIRLDRNGNIQEVNNHMGVDIKERMTDLTLILRVMQASNQIQEESKIERKIVQNRI